MARPSYFDYNATTRVHPEVVALMNKYSHELYGNAGSVHDYGLQAHEGLEYGRKAAADVLDASKTEIIFTSGGTEADNLAIQGFLYKYREDHPGIRPHLIIDAIEHPAVWETANFLETQGFEVTRLPVDKFGLVEPAAVEGAIKENTALISIMYANNEIGSINPIQEIGFVAKKLGIRFHTDAVQAFGKVLISPRSENIDMLSVSAHKFYGPKGVGFLYVQNDPDAPKNESTAKRHIRPLMYGGSQEFGLRPATENVPGIVGMGKAIELFQWNYDQEYERLCSYRDYLISHILHEIPNTELNGHPTKRLPNNVNVRIQDVFAYDLMVHLDSEGVACSVGAACHAGNTQPSRVLLGIGVTPAEAESSLRFSFGEWTTREDLDELLRLLDKYVPLLRK